MTYSILVLVTKRLLNNINIVFSTILGLVVTVTLVSSVPLYSEGMSEMLLHRALRDTESRQAQPRASLLIRKFEQKNETNISLLQYQQADEYMRVTAPTEMGIPLLLSTRYAQTEHMPILSAGDDVSLSSRQFQDWGFIAFATDFDNHVRILEGRYAKPAKSGDPYIEAVIMTEKLDAIGAQVGDTLIANYRGPNSEPQPILVKVVGRWFPNDPNEIYWFYHPQYFKEGLMVPDETFIDVILSDYEEIGYEYTWFSVFDVDAVNASNARAIVTGISEIRSNLGNILGKVKIDISPEDILQRYLRDLFFLKILLFILSAPVIGIVLYYIGIASSMVVDRQRNEIAVLKSRGASTWQIIGIYLLEGGMIGVLALVVGPVLGVYLAQLIARTYTFLTFIGRDPLPITITTSTFNYALAAIALSIGAALMPAAATARHSIVTFKQEASRKLRRPWWQRFFLDILLLALSVYGYRLLQDQRQVVVLGEEGDVFSNPLLLIVPSVFMFGMALFFVRLFPYIVELVTRIGNRFWGVSMLLGLRHISRSAGQYNSLLLLLVLTLAIGTFSASVAATLTRNHSDSVYYRIGADMAFYESGDYDEELEQWYIAPFSDHLLVEEIKAVARFWDSKGNAILPDRATPEIQIVAIDPWDAVNVMYWRPDFAHRSLVTLMNELAAQPDAILASANFMIDHKLKVGDRVRINLRQRQIDFVIVDWVDYFPTQFPDTDYFAIANLDYIFDNIGLGPYDAWVKTDPGADIEVIEEKLRDLDFIVVRTQDTREKVIAQRDDPQRTGVFGMLTVGFLIAILLTVLGFLTYSLLSFQRRMQDFGILRAMGLSIRQLVSLYIFEQGFLIVMGVTMGTVFGVAAGRIFIPFLQIKTGEHANIPSFVVLTAWDDIAKIYAILGIILIIAVPVIIKMLTRMRIHEAIKFGEEQG